MLQIIDAHTHIGLQKFLVRPISEERLKKPAFQDPLENPLENLINQMELNSLSKSIAFPYPLDEIDSDLANEYVIQAYQRYPEKIIPFVLVNNDLEKWIKKGAKGIKQQDILLSPGQFDLDHIYNVASESGIPLIRHFRSGNGFNVVDQVREMISKFPRLNLIIAHMGRGKPNTGEFVIENLMGLKEFSNVYFETSTVRDSLVIQQAVEIVGAERVLFGTDFPFNSYQDANPVAIELQIINKMKISKEEIHQILGSNLSSLLEIENE